MSARPARPVLVPLLAALLIPAAAAAGPAPWAEPLPWDALDTPPGVRFEAQRFDDPDSGWRVDALGLTSVVARGPRNRVYLRWRHLNVHTDGRPVFARWPDAMPDTEEPVDPGWPGEAAISGWGRPEVGLLAPVTLPVVGESAFCGEAALPFARNDLYPFAARSIALRLALRRSVPLGARLSLALQAERIMNLGAAGEDLSDDAFPSVTAWGGALAWSPGGGRRLTLEGRATDAAARRLGLTLSWPLGDDRRLRVGLLHSLADADDRLYATRLSVGLSFGLADPDGPREEPDDTPVPDRGETP